MSTWHLKARTCPGTKWVSVWLVRRSGAADECYLHGEVMPRVVDELAAATGLPVEREEGALANVKPIPVPECLPVEKQLALFPPDPG